MNRVLITDLSLLTILADNVPSNRGRQSLVNGLIKAYDLHDYCQIVPILSPVSCKQLSQYHDSEFVHHLLTSRVEIDQQIENYESIRESIRRVFHEEVSETEAEITLNEEQVKEKDNQFGLAHDCYVFPFMRYYIRLTAASTVCLVNAIFKLWEEKKEKEEEEEGGGGGGEGEGEEGEEGEEERIIGLNWYGGRHHCHRARCSGFCYINDIVLGISALRKLTSGTIFYLDLDLHDGDGVAEAFRFSRKVVTCSIHRYDIGFFPGSGGLAASTDGMYNIPTKRGLNDKSMGWIIENIVLPLIAKRQPQFLVVQAGCDGLNTDPHKEWNMTIKGYTSALCRILSKVKVPVIILGGGGYNFTETAKCWAFLTGKLIGHGHGLDPELWDEIPEHQQLDNYEKDGFRFWTEENSFQGKMKDENDQAYLNQLRDYLLSISERKW